MRRREFVTLFGSAVGWPLVARAQQNRVRRLGIMLAANQTPEYVSALAAFKEVLQSLGWKPGDNLRVDEHWSVGDPTILREAVKKIVALNPDVIFAQSAPVVEALRSVSSTIPIVFVHVADPVDSGFVANFAHPGGNVTGITNIEPSIGGKWLQLLKEVAPSVTRAALIFNPEMQPRRGAIFFDPFEVTARALGVTPVSSEVHDIKDVESTMARLGTQSSSGIVVTPDAYFAGHSIEIVTLAERFRLPTVYPYRYYVAQGGLMCYGVNNTDLFRQAAPYVDRIMRGEKTTDLPVQAPTRFELVLNLKTAKSLGLAVSPTLLARADEVIE